HLPGGDDGRRPARPDALEGSAARGSAPPAMARGASGGAPALGRGAARPLMYTRQLGSPPSSPNPSHWGSPRECVTRVSRLRDFSSTPGQKGQARKRVATDSYEPRKARYVAATSAGVPGSEPAVAFGASDATSSAYTLSGSFAGAATSARA